MNQEPSSFIIASMPDTKHCIMYWKLLATDTQLLKASSKKAFNRLNSARSSLMCTGIILWVQRQEERHLINRAYKNTNQWFALVYTEHQKCQKTSCRLLTIHIFPSHFCN